MIVTAITQQLREKSRYSIYVDGKFAFGLSADALLESRLVVGQELDSQQLNQLKQLSRDDKAYAATIRYLAIRPRSEWEVQTYLKRKQIDPELATKIVLKMRDLRLVDDAAFARSWVDSRRLLKSISRRKLDIELKQKHIASSIIDSILNEDKEETDEQSVLRELVERKKARYSDRQKFMQYLARQGFNYDDIKSVLNEEL